MEMTTDEIVRSFREAKDRRKQVTILAELNDCSVEEIRSTLVAGGISWRELPRAPRAGKTPNAATTEDPSESRKSPPQTEIAPEIGAAIATEMPTIKEALIAYCQMLREKSAQEDAKHRARMATMSSKIHSIELLLERLEGEVDERA